MNHAELIHSPKAINQIGELSRVFAKSGAVKQGFTVTAVLHMEDGSFTVDQFEFSARNQEWSDLLRADGGRLARSLEFVDGSAAMWAIKKGGRL